MWTPLVDIGPTGESRRLVSNGQGNAALVSTSLQGLYSEVVFVYPDDNLAPTPCIAEWGLRNAGTIHMMYPTTAVWMAPGSRPVHAWVIYPNPADEDVEIAVRHYVVEMQ